ncbi:hypothetical protein [Pseudomonas shirazensis]|uniref:hypothetical protein n=1 Tax=Pseudomonas shirazensis TaxID=2745494 RepID=UPI003D28EEA7
MNIQATQWLSRFRVDITSNSNRVFANGRQQLQVTVTLAARDGKAISEAQLDSIYLFEIDQDGQYQRLDNDLLAERERDFRFDYHAASGGVVQPLPDANNRTRRRTFYVSSICPGGSLHTVYAGIQYDADAQFATDTAPFKSSVVIESIAPPVAHRSLFQLSLEPKRAYKKSSANYWDDEIEEQIGFFGFSDPQRKIVATVAHGISSGIRFYERNNFDEALISFELTNHYSQTCFICAYQPDHPAEDLPAIPRAHQMLLHLFHRRFYSRHWNDSWVELSAWTLIDQHGNAYTVHFLPGESGRSVDFRVVESAT